MTEHETIAAERPLMPNMPDCTSCRSAKHVCLGGPGERGTNYCIECHVYFTPEPAPESKAVCPKCGGADRVISHPQGTYPFHCERCEFFFGTLSEPEADIHVELPSGAIARVTVEGAKDPKLLDALNQMMIAAAKQFTHPAEPLSLDQPAPESKAKCAECERKDAIALQIFNGGPDMAIGEIRYLLAQVFPLDAQPSPNAAN